VALDVLLIFEDGSSLWGISRDVSLGGIFIETKTVVPFGARVTVSIPLRTRAVDLRIDGSVRWTNPEGVGVQFGLMGARATYELSALLAAAHDPKLRQG
jgi:type IV pilus assembly protein PilZ